jgi:predicted RNA-binding Zn ribbon-like protein
MDPLWAELINSDWRDYRGSGRRADRLADDAWLGPFLRRAGWRGASLPDAAQRERLRRVRRLLRDLVDALRGGQELQEEDLARLNRLLAAAPVVRQLERAGDAWRISTRSGQAGLDGVEAEVVWSFACLLAEGDPARIKVCANPDCSWVMYDGSRNRTRRWCEASECGNLIKVRRFRERQRARAADQPERP